MSRPGIEQAKCHGPTQTAPGSGAMAPDRSQLIPPEVMVTPLIWLCSNDSDGVNGQRLIAMRWDDSLPPAEAAKRAGAPAAWQQLGRQAIMPERMR